MMGCDECGATTAWPITLVALKPLSHPDHEGGRHHYEANVDNILEPAGRRVLQMLEYVGPERARQVLEQHVPHYG